MPDHIADATKKAQLARCPHCDGWFFPEEGVSLDDCPVCGRTVEVKPAPAPCSGCGCEHDEIHNPTDTCATCNGGSRYHPPKPAPAPGATCKESLQVRVLPESDDVADALAEISAAGLGAVADGLHHHISDLTLRLAEAEEISARRATCLETVGLHADCTFDEAKEYNTTIKNRESYGFDVATRCLKAEARVRELEATIDAMAEAHAHDDMALTAAYLSGAHEGKKQAEAERDALRERCEKLEVVRKAAAAYRESEGGKSFTHWSQRVSNTRELDNALAATEVKP